MDEIAIGNNYNLTYSKLTSFEKTFDGDYIWIIVIIIKDSSYLRRECANDEWKPSKKSKWMININNDQWSSRGSSFIDQQGGGNE